MVAVSMTSHPNTSKRMWTKLLRVPYVGKLVEISMMQRNIWRVNISPLIQDMNANHVTIILILFKLSPSTTQNIIAINRIFLIGMFDAGNIEELATKYITRNPDKSCLCSICGKTSRDFYNAKGHLESKHFPSESGYACQPCGSHFNTFQAFSKHNSRYHRIK